jgi:hypothetical protein
MLTEVDRKSHSYLLGVAEVEIADYREILAGLVRYVKDDFEKLPDGYGARRYLDRALAKLNASATHTSGTRAT